MIYIFENPNNETSRVYDETTLTEQEKAKGIAREELPPKEEIEGKQAVLKCRKSTNEVWWEYEDIKPNEDIELLKAQIALQDGAILELAELLGGLLNG